MKASFLGLALLFLFGDSILAQNVVPSGAASARDGFTKSGTDILLTRGGVSQKVDQEVALENGLRVRPDGSVTLPNGSKASLGNNQLLTLQGSLEDVALLPQGTAPVTSGGPPMKKPGEEVGVSSTDGVSVSSGTVLVTRNGATERLSRELKLANGTLVQVDGTVTLANGKQITLLADQVLTFDGVLHDAPPRPAPATPRAGGTAPRSGNPGGTSPR